MAEFTENDFDLKKRYCPSVGHNVPIIVYIKDSTEVCLCIKDCGKRQDCERCNPSAAKDPSAR